MTSWRSTSGQLRRSVQEIVRHLLNDIHQNIWIFHLLDTTDTDYSESEAFSSLQISGKAKSPPMSPPSHSEGMVMRIETARAPVPSQPELVMSDGKCFFFCQHLRKEMCTWNRFHNLIGFLWNECFCLQLSFSTQSFISILYLWWICAAVTTSCRSTFVSIK